VSDAGAARRIASVSNRAAIGHRCGMAHGPDVDISIRWKVMGAFVVTAVLPIVLAMAGTPVVVVATAGVLVALALALYSTRQILKTIEQLRGVTARLGGRGAEGHHHADELAELVDHVSDLVGQVEAKLGDAAPARVQARPSGSRTGRQVFPARFGTGSAVEGEGAPLPRREIEASAVARAVTGPRARELFHVVRDRARRDLARLQAEAGLQPSERGILEFQALLLDDVALVAGVERALDEGRDLLEGLATTFGALIAELEESERAYLRERADDCRDLERRLLLLVHGEVVPDAPDAGDAVRDRIVACAHLLPTEVLFLHRSGARGIVVERGSVSSHTQILLQSLDVPSLTQFDELPVGSLVGQPLLLDPMNRRLVLRPNAQDKAALERGVRVEVTGPPQPVTLESGEAFAVLATVNNAFIEAKAAKAAGADGIGLFRSEMTFIGRAEPPRETDLVEEYRHLTAAFPDAPVVMRILDLGYDKLAFLGGGAGDGGAMGLRSIRLLERHPDLLRTQLRAMLRVATPRTTILLPFVSGLDEAERARERLDAVRAEIGEAPPVGWGLMVEVPAVAARFEDYVDRFDSFSIGSNDLTQYTLAADRNDSAVADYYRVTHPAVLSLVANVCSLAASRGKPVSLCGEAACQTDLLPLWIGLGLNAVSVPHRMVPRLKSEVATLRREDCLALAAEALRRRSARDVEDVLRQSSPNV
jgi:phosphoenolpyruvate-protein kinase (PTS system EI component)